MQLTSFPCLPLSIITTQRGWGQYNKPWVRVLSTSCSPHKSYVMGRFSLQRGVFVSLLLFGYILYIVSKIFCLKSFTYYGIYLFSNFSIFPKILLQFSEFLSECILKYIFLNLKYNF